MLYCEKEYDPRDDSFISVSGQPFKNSSICIWLQNAKKKKSFFQITIIIPTLCHLMSTAISSVIYWITQWNFPLPLFLPSCLGMWEVLNCLNSIQSKKWYLLFPWDVREGGSKEQESRGERKGVRLWGYLGEKLVTSTLVAPAATKTEHVFQNAETWGIWQSLIS